LADDITVKEQI